MFVDSKSTIKTQAAQIGKLAGKLWHPKKNDIPQYTEMYQTLKDLYKTLKSFKNNTELSDDMKQNILAEKFKLAEDQINEYQKKISKEPTRNDRKRIAITESIKSIAIDNRNSRERQVNEMNTVMAYAVKHLNNLNKNLEKTKPGSMEFKLAEMELKATGTLAAYIGNIEMPKGQEKLDADMNIARLCLVEKLNELKTQNPERYNLHLENFGKDPGAYLEKMAVALSQNKQFKSLMSKVSPSNVIQFKTAEKVKSIAEDMDIFKEIGIDAKEPKLSAEKQVQVDEPKVTL